MSNSTINSTDTNINKTKKLLNMFLAAHHIQEEMMWEKPAEGKYFGKYKKSYRQILTELQDLHEDIKNSIEAKVFSMTLTWFNDLQDIIDAIIEEEFGSILQENQNKYFAKYVQKYVDEYVKHYLNTNDRNEQ